MKIDVSLATQLSAYNALLPILVELDTIPDTCKDSTELTPEQANAVAIALGAEYHLAYTRNSAYAKAVTYKPPSLSKIAGEWVLNLQSFEIPREPEMEDSLEKVRQVVADNKAKATRREQIVHLLSLEAYTKLHENGVLPQFVDSVLSIEENSEATLQHHQKVAIAILLGAEFSVERTYLTLGDTPKVYCDIHALEARRVSQYMNLSVPGRPLGISWRLV